MVCVRVVDMASGGSACGGGTGPVVSGLPVQALLSCGGALEKRGRFNEVWVLS